MYKRQAHYINEFLRSGGAERPIASVESPTDLRDETMRGAIEHAAKSLRRDPSHSFLERMLVDAVAAAWESLAPGGLAKANVKLAVPGWDPAPGHTDLVLGLPGDAHPTAIAELKVLDVEDTLWDAVKLASIVEHDSRIDRAYLIVATTPARWGKAEVAPLYAPSDSAAPDGVREWDTRDLFERWKRVWRHLLGGGSGRPRDLPGHLRTRFVAAQPVEAFVGYEVRCIAVEPVGAGTRLRFGSDGWPVATPIEGSFTLRDLVVARRAAERWALAHPDLRDYHRRRAEALARALGIRPDEPPPASDGGLLALLEATELQLDRLRSPFDDFLEASEPVAAAYGRHGPAIADQSSVMREHLVGLAADLVAQVWELDPALAVGRDALAAAGFDPGRPEPDPIDYL